MRLEKAKIQDVRTEKQATRIKMQEARDKSLPVLLLGSCSEVVLHLGSCSEVVLASWLFNTRTILSFSKKS
jgi:hypothetical protein